MRYALYAVLVLVGIGGLLFGFSLFGSRVPADQFHSVLFLLIGTVGIGSLGVIMAIEHATAKQVVELQELRRFAVQAEKRAQALDAAAAVDK